MIKNVFRTFAGILADLPHAPTKNVNGASLGRAPQFGPVFLLKLWTGAGNGIVQPCAVDIQKQERERKKSSLWTSWKDSSFSSESFADEMSSEGTGQHVTLTAGKWTYPFPASPPASLYSPPLLTPPSHNLSASLWFFTALLIWCFSLRNRTAPPISLTQHPSLSLSRSLPHSP